MNIITNNKWIGQRTIRPDGADKVTGRAAFAADTTMPGMIWGKVLRSPHPHARIRSIDTSKAEALPGVKAVVTARDIVDFPIDKSVMLGIQDMRWMCRNVMARDKALFPGHPVAAVAATTEAIAAKACELIEVDYEVLPWSIEIDDAIKPDAPILHEFIKFEGKPSNIAGKLEIKKGDIAQGFAEAEVVVERSFTTRPVHQGYIEPHACLISVGADNKTTIWSSSQGQFMVRAMTAYLTGIPQSDIRAIPAEIGGGFGGKTIVYLEPLATLLAKKSGRHPARRARSRSAPRRTAPSSPRKARFICRPARCPARRSAVRSAAAFRLTISRTCFPSATTSFPIAPRSRPIARRARRSAPMRWSVCSMNSPKRSRWIRCNCG
jgi:CO/xanthine dehydrogenase Mo-binding subunit